MYVHVEQRDGNGWKYVACAEKRECTYCSGKLYQEWYYNQNYHCMAVLANVRNYDSVIPVSSLRHLAEDVSEELREIIEEEIDGLACSWLLLSEIKSYDFEQTVTLWSKSWTNEDGTVSTSNCSDRGRHWLNGRLLTLEEQGYTPVQVPIREEVGDLLRMVNQIEKALPGVDPHDIRLMLFFSI